MQFLRVRPRSPAVEDPAGDNGSRLKELTQAALASSKSDIKLLKSNKNTGADNSASSTSTVEGEAQTLQQTTTTTTTTTTTGMLLVDKTQTAIKEQAGGPRRRRRMWDVIVEKASLSSRSFRGKGDSSGSSGFHRASSEESGFANAEGTSDLTIFTSMSTMDALSSSRNTLASSRSSGPLQQHPQQPPHHPQHQQQQHHHRSTAQPFSIIASQLSMVLVDEEEAVVSYEIQKHDLDELGYMSFRHDSLEGALEQAARTHKPVFDFSAEIPGDIAAGREIFSHPLIVEAAQSLFVTVRSAQPAPPMARTPHGRICCTRVRLFDDTGRELGPLISGENLTRTGLLKAMIHALEECDLAVPRYLSLLLEEELGYIDMLAGESAGEETRLRCLQAYLGVNDPALAEAELAGLDGVLATRTGTLEREKVIEVTYDSKKLSFSTIARYAVHQGVAKALYHASNEERMVAMIEVSRIPRYRTVAVRRLQEDDMFQKSYDPKHALRRTPMRFVPLTPFQATRANRLIHFGSFNEAMQILSPRQGLILMKAMRVTAQQSLHEVVDETILLAWNSVCSQEHPSVLKRKDTEPWPEDDDSSSDR